jgi:hypothetical protein
MLKWLFFGFIGLIAVVVGGTWMLGSIFMSNANKEGTFASEVYESAVGTQLQYTCNFLLKQLPGITDDNSEKQLKSTCTCFSDSMAKKVKQIAVDDLQEYLNKPATQKTAEAVIERCAHQAGIAYE